MPDTSTGVFYATSDYAGLFRRLAVDAIDGILLACTWVATIIALVALQTDGPAARQIFFLVFAITAFGYLVLLKKYARTPGYLLLKIRVVNLQGGSPSIGSLMLRALFVFIGPGNMLLDLLWLTSDPNRQAIRDKLARTYVIRDGSKPVGEGHIRYTRLDMLGFQLLYPEVTPDVRAPQVVEHSR